MRDFRTYMAVGVMPQVVEAFILDKNFESVDRIKKGNSWTTFEWLF